MLRSTQAFLSLLSALTLACAGAPTGPATAAPADAGPPPAAAQGTTPPSAPLANQAVSQGPGPLAGLAQRVCPLGPFPSPIEGERQAEEIAGTTPAALNPKDTDFHIFEGPVWWNDALYFSDFRGVEGFPSRVLRYVPGEKLTVVAADAGTNGLALDAEGAQLLGASHKVKNVVRFGAQLASSELVTHGYQGAPFDSPNDLVSRSDGQLYFTDPDFQAGAHKDQAQTRVYWAKPNGEVVVVDSSLKNPNGIAISPDEKFLFVSGNLEEGFVKRYPLAVDGSPGEGVVVLAGVSIPDGLAFDCAGHLYVTEHMNRRIRVVTQDGEELGRIGGLSKNVTNVAFGGPQRQTLFITMTGGLAKIEMPVPGLPY